MSDRNEYKSNISQQVSKKIGSDIVNGVYQVGQALPTEAEFSTEFNASRTSVREAIKMLSAKGLVSSKPRRGIRVMPEEAWNIFDTDILTWALKGKPSFRVVTEFFQLRVAVEPEAAGLAAQFGLPEQKAAIWDALGRMRDTEDKSEDAMSADLDFHIGILYATRNRFYIHLKDFIRSALNVTIQHTTPAAASYDEVLATHERVVRAIEAGDTQRARMSMRLLIEDAYSLMKEPDVDIEVTAS